MTDLVDGFYKKTPRPVEIAFHISLSLTIESMSKMVSRSVECPHYGAARVTACAEEGKICRSLKYDRWRKPNLAALVRSLY